MKRTEIINALFLPVGNKTKHLTSRSFVLADFGRVKALKSYSCTKASTLLVRKPLWHWTVLFWWFQYKNQSDVWKVFEVGTPKSMSTANKQNINITNIVDAPISKYKGLFRSSYHLSRASVLICYINPGPQLSLLGQPCYPQNWVFMMHIHMKKWKNKYVEQ